ncbi:MAG TPA: sulfotransferase [Acidimicrobiia bacterium]
MIRRLESAGRRATSSIRALPDFIVIGAPRSGTTSLWKHLSSHPGVIPALRKELHYFDHRFERGLPWYRAHFPLRRSLRDGRITGEATPQYLGFPGVPARVRSVVPSAKLVVLLRNPIERTFSAWQLKVREGIEELDFERALEQEEARLAKPSRRPGADMRYAYKAKSRYAEQLEAWFEHFPRNQMLVLKSEDLFDDGAQPLSELYRFLEIPIDAGTASNARIPTANASPTASSMDDRTRAELASYFEPHNRRLYELLGRDFGW